jgi:hypothetical protein
MAGNESRAQKAWMQQLFYISLLRLKIKSHEMAWPIPRDAENGGST